MNADRLVLINAGSTCGECGRIIGRGQKSHRVMAEGRLVIRHVDCAAPPAAGLFTVGTRVRLARPGTVAGRSDEYIDVGSEGEVQRDRYDAAPERYPDLIQVRFDSGTLYWLDRQCFDVIYHEGNLPLGWYMCECGCGAVYDKDNGAPMGRISPVTGEWTAAVNGRVLGL